MNNAYDKYPVGTVPTVANIWWQNIFITENILEPTNFERDYGIVTVPTSKNQSTSAGQHGTNYWLA